MMQNKVYETVPSTYASNNIPTLLGSDGNSPNGDYLNDHPVGLTTLWSVAAAPITGIALPATAPSA